MINVFHKSWVCNEYVKPYCHNHPDLKIMRQILELNAKFKIIDIGYLKTATNTQNILKGVK